MRHLQRFIFFMGIVVLMALGRPSPLHGQGIEDMIAPEANREESGLTELDIGPRISLSVGAPRPGRPR